MSDGPQSVGCSADDGRVEFSEVINKAVINVLMGLRGCVWTRLCFFWVNSQEWDCKAVWQH